MADQSLPPKHKSCRRYNDTGHAHALTFTCFRGQPFLSRNRTREWFVQSLETARNRSQFDVWAYVVMPEHCHLLIWPRRSPYSISTILQAIKLPVARRAVSWIKKHCASKLSLLRDEQPNGEVAHRFWQRGGGFDQNLIDEKLIYATVDYLHLNPVRRGLVEKAADWRWSSAGFYAGQSDTPLVPDFKTLPTNDGTR